MIDNNPTQIEQLKILIYGDKNFDEETFIKNYFGNDLKQKNDLEEFKKFEGNIKLIGGEKKCIFYFFKSDKNDFPKFSIDFDGTILIFELTNEESCKLVKSRVKSFSKKVKSLIILGDNPENKEIAINNDIKHFVYENKIDYYEASNKNQKTNIMKIVISTILAFKTVYPEKDLKNEKNNSKSNGHGCCHNSCC